MKEFENTVSQREVLMPANEPTVHNVSRIRVIKPLPLLREKREPHKWAPVMDALLTEGVALYKESGGWKGVAEHVGGGVTLQQCKSRWNNKLGKVQQEGIRKAEWSDEEICKLEELVPQHVIKSHWSEHYKVMTQERTDWTAIGKVMNRVPSECRYKWRNLQARRMKKGPFTAEEDALIRQRVAEWGDKGKGNGLWVSLQQELGRSMTVIYKRWTHTLRPYDETDLSKPSENQTKLVETVRQSLWRLMQKKGKA